MHKQFKIILSIITIGLFSGCIPAPKPQIAIGIGGIIGQNNQVKEPIQTQQPIKTVHIDKEYGAKPLNYVTSIRSYFSTKIARGNLST